MGTLLLSWQSWSVHLVRGRPGGRFHVVSRVDRSIAWPGVRERYLAILPHMALRPLIIRSDTGARPVRKETSESGTKSCHLIPRILRWQCMWKDSMAFMSLSLTVTFNPRQAMPMTPLSLQSGGCRSGHSATSSHHTSLSCTNSNSSSMSHPVSLQQVG